MSDNPDKRGKADRDRFNPKQAFERRALLKRLKVITDKGLRAAAKDRGPMVKNIKAWLIEQIEKA